MSRQDLETEYTSFATALSDDELRVLVVQARRMTRIGHAKYGPLDLSKESRDWTIEIAAESADRLFYDSCREIARAERKRELVEQFKQAHLDHWNCLVANDQCTDCGVDVFPQKAATAVSELTQQLAESFEEEQTGEHKFARAQTCDDCDAPRTEPHADDCAWVTVVPGAVS